MSLTLVFGNISQKKGQLGLNCIFYMPHVQVKYYITRNYSLLKAHVHSWLTVHFVIMFRCTGVSIVYIGHVGGCFSIALIYNCNVSSFEIEAVIRSQKPSPYSNCK